MNSNELEREIVNKCPTAPRVTLEDLNSNIKNVEYVRYVSITGQVLRWAIITTPNGFACVGRPSVSASSENDRNEIGEKVALENSKNELWPLLGYLLKQNQYEGSV